MGSPDGPIPGWIRKWMISTAFVFFVDGIFCILRPHTLPDGCIGTLFYVYGIYIQLDKHYADTSDSFIFAQGIGSIIEATLHVVVLANLLKNSRWTKLLAIVANVMVCWKTTLFDLYSLDVPKGGMGPDFHWFPHFFIVFVTSWIWILCPAYAVLTLARDFIEPDSKRK